MRKRPAELVKALRDAVDAFEKKPGDEKAHLKFQEDAFKYLTQVRAVLFGDAEPKNEPDAAAVMLLAREIYQSSLIRSLLQHFAELGFEGRKLFVLIFTNLLNLQANQRRLTVEYLALQPDMFDILLKASGQNEIALHCATMLKEAARYEPLATRILHSPHFDLLFDHMELPAFDVAAQAANVFHDVLTLHPNLCSDYLGSHFDHFFELYMRLLRSENYATKRMNLKLLAEILLEPKNFDHMKRFISDVSHLKTVMQLLREDAKTIRFEAFHVFKVFVAYPQKPPEVRDILQKNRDRLIRYLENFLPEHKDAQFIEEKGILIEELQRLEPSDSAASAAASATASAAASSAPAPAAHAPQPPPA